MLSAVTIKAWCRPDMLDKTLVSITKAYNYKDRDYIISLDNHEGTREEMIEAVKKFKDTGATVKVFYHPKNLGCAGNMRFCFNKAFIDTNYDYMFHLEEDTIVGRDVFNYIDWSMNLTKDDDKIFVVSPFTRKAQQEWYPEIEDDICKSFKHDHFECGGGWAMHRVTYEEDIKARGDVFGAVGACNTDIPDPDKWKETITVTDKGSWAWPFNKYFKRDKYSISPMVSRSNNIGDEKGVFNPNKKWHHENVWDDRWIESERFKANEVKDLVYLL